MSSVEKPGVPRSTRKPPISPSSSLAQTTATSAMEPLVIQSLVPFRTYASPCRRARVFIEPGSEPWSGSVRPKHPTFSPVARRGSHFSFCASEPYAWMGYMKARLDRRHRAEARVAALELLHDQPVRDVVEPGAPVALERGAEDAEFAELRDQLNRESPRAVVLGDHREELGLHPVADRVTNHSLLFREEVFDLVVIDAAEFLHGLVLATQRRC